MQQAREYLGQYRIPKKLRPIIIKELEVMQLIKIKDNEVHLIHCNIVPEKELTRLSVRRKVIDKMCNSNNFFDY